MSKPNTVTIGKITAVFGLKGWVKVFSYTEPKENILGYKQFKLIKGSEVKAARVINGQMHGKNILVQFEGVSDRDQAQLFTGYEVVVGRDELPSTEENEYYWADLIGLEVENKDGFHLGKIEDILETGANDVLLIKGDKERAVPFLQKQTILSVDLVNGKMIVDWDAEF